MRTKNVFAPFCVMHKRTHPKTGLKCKLDGIILEIVYAFSTKYTNGKWKITHVFVKWNKKVKKMLLEGKIFHLLKNPAQIYFISRVRVLWGI